MTDLIQEKLRTYTVGNAVEEENATKEILQEIDVALPAYSGETQTFLYFPLDHQVRHQDLESNFALKRLMRLMLKLTSLGYHKKWAEQSVQLIGRKLQRMFNGFYAQQRQSRFHCGVRPFLLQSSAS